MMGPLTDLQRHCRGTASRGCHAGPRRGTSCRGHRRGPRERGRVGISVPVRLLKAPYHF